MQDRVETTLNEQVAKRHWRIPELAVGLVLMLGGALGAILLSRSGNSIVIVVGAAHDLQRGEKITPQNLIAIETPLSFADSFVTEDQVLAPTKNCLLCVCGHIVCAVTWRVCVSNLSRTNGRYFQILFKLPSRPKS